MKTVRLIILLSVLFLRTLCHARADKPPLDDVLKNWTTVRITAAFHGGDFEPHHPFILLQRLDSDRIIVSSSQKTPGKEDLPVARAIITPSAAQEIIDRATALYAQANKEVGEASRIRNLPDAERRKILKKPSFGIDSLNMDIQVLSGDKNYDYEDDFADDGKGFGALVDLIEQQATLSH